VSASARQSDPPGPGQDVGALRPAAPRGHPRSGGRLPVRGSGAGRLRLVQDVAAADLRL